MRIKDLPQGDAPFMGSNQPKAARSVTLHGRLSKTPAIHLRSTPRQEFGTPGPGETAQCCSVISQIRPLDCHVKLSN